MFYQKPQCLKIGQRPFSKCSSLCNKSTKCVWESFELKRRDPFNSACFTSPCLQRCGFIVSLQAASDVFCETEPATHFLPACSGNKRLFVPSAGACMRAGAATARWTARTAQTSSTAR